MTSQDVLINHILESLHAGMAEAAGHEDEAEHLRARTKLRLLSMSDEEIWELATMLSSPRNISTEWTYEEIKQATREHSTTTDQWIKYL